MALSAWRQEVARVHDGMSTTFSRRPETCRTALVRAWKDRRREMWSEQQPFRSSLASLLVTVARKATAQQKAVVCGRVTGRLVTEELAVLETRERQRVTLGMALLEAEEVSLVASPQEISLN